LLKMHTLVTKGSKGKVLSAHAAALHVAREACERATKGEAPAHLTATTKSIAHRLATQYRHWKRSITD
jgi:hypothetical protein